MRVYASRTNRGEKANFHSCDIENVNFLSNIYPEIHEMKQPEALTCTRWTVLQ